MLTVIGDDLGNSITIDRSPSSIRVVGTDTLVNGSPTSFLFEGVVSAVQVNTFGGADAVSIRGDAGFSLSGTAAFDLGDGNNTLQLVTTGELSLGGLVVKGGDGLDSVQVDGAPGSQVATSAFLTYGVGGSSTSIKHLTVAGPGSVTLAAADGGDTLTLDGCQAKAVTFSGGYGPGTLNIKNGTVGPVTLNGSQGPAGLSLVNATVNGAVKATGPEGIQVSLAGSTVNGPLTASGGLFDLDSAVGLSVAGTSAVTGDVTVKGYTTALNFQTGSGLTVGGNLFASATDALTGAGANAAVAAKGLKLSSPRAVTFTQDPAGSLTLTGPLDATGRVVDVQFGTVTVPKSVTVQGTARAAFKAAGTVGQNLTVTSAGGSAALNFGGPAPTAVTGNLYVSGKLTTAVGLSGTYHGFVTVNGGPKDDSFGVGDATFEKNVTVQLQDGNNVVGICAFGPWDPAEILGNLKVTTGNGADLVGFRCHVAGMTTVLTGGGADTVQAYQATFDGAAVINTGAGDDTLILMDAPFFDVPLTFNGKATIDAGAGNDTLVMGKAPGDPQAGGGDANSKVAFAPGKGSTVSGGAGFNTFDDEAGQFTGVALGVDVTGWADPT